MRFIKEIQGHMRLRTSGDRHELRQQYFSVVWYHLIQELLTKGKEGISEVIEFMDSYFLTKDDWDSFLELGVGPLDVENVKMHSQVRSIFTRSYNQMAHPLPYMKASQVVAPRKKDKERPDIEEALDESDSGVSEGEGQAVLDDDEPLDLKKDKYVKAAKPKAKVRAAAATDKGKGKGKVKKEECESEGDDEIEDVKPKKGSKGKGRAKK